MASKKKTDINLNDPMLSPLNNENATEAHVNNIPCPTCGLEKEADKKAAPIDKQPSK